MRWRSEPPPEVLGFTGEDPLGEEAARLPALPGGGGGGAGGGGGRGGGVRASNLEVEVEVVVFVQV